MPKLKFHLLIIFLILFILHGWFSAGKIISNNSEENLDILSPSRTALHFSTIWWSVGTGTINPFLLPREPVFWTLSLMEKAGVPIFLIQAIFIGSLMYIGMISIYAFAKYGFKLSEYVAGLSSLFYLLNIYSLTQIWKRFLYDGMIAWTYLPIFLLFWFKWILELRFRWLGLFLVSSLFFSYTYAHPAYFLTFWVPAAILVLIRMWDFKKDIKGLLKLAGFSILGLILWCIINIWWLYPTVLLSTDWSSENFPQPHANLDVLTAVSQSFPIHEILLLRQGWYLGPENDWNNFYHNPLIYIISICIFGIAVWGFLKLKGNNYRKYITWLAIIGLFVSKGTNFPLGYSFYNFLFSTFPYTASLRNSYEKFGVVWLLPYAVFFSYGLYWIFLKIKKRYKMIFLVLTLFLSCGVLVYPMWNGNIFPPRHRLYIPDYYNQANVFLNSQKTERLFHIPFLTEGAKMTYDWSYVGEDPSENIFDSENLSSAYVLLYDKTLKLLSGYFDNKNVTSIFGLLGAQYIVFQRDIVYPEINFIKTQKQIESWKGISKAKTFGKLDLYSIDPKIVKPRIYTSGNIIMINSLTEALNRVASDEWNDNFVFTLQDIGIELKNNSTPQIVFTKISPTKYKVNIIRSKDSYILILNNSYDKFWKAKIDNQVVEKHFIINGFANGWVIYKKGDYQIEINFAIWPWD